MAISSVKRDVCPDREATWGAEARLSSAPALVRFERGARGGTTLRRSFGVPSTGGTRSAFSRAEAAGGTPSSCGASFGMLAGIATDAGAGFWRGALAAQ